MSKDLYPAYRRLWLPFDSEWTMSPKTLITCCEDMTKAINFSCPQHSDPFTCPDGLVVYNQEVKLYGIPIHDGGTSYLTISFCPWCGKQL